MYASDKKLKYFLSLLQISNARPNSIIVFTFTNVRVYFYTFLSLLHNKNFSGTSNFRNKKFSDMFRSFWSLAGRYRPKPMFSSSIQHNNLNGNINFHIIFKLLCWMAELNIVFGLWRPKSDQTPLLDFK